MLKSFNLINCKLTKKEEKVLNTRRDKDKFFLEFTGALA
jgi:hypothetical protein